MLAIVVLPNDIYAVGTYVELKDGMAEKVRVAQRNGRLAIGKYYGLAVPADSIRPYIQYILKRGFDDQGAHKTARTVTVH